MRMTVAMMVNLFSIPEYKGLVEFLSMRRTHSEICLEALVTQPSMEVIEAKRQALVAPKVSLH